MNILAKYVLRKFLRPFFASFGSLCVIILVSQVFERLDHFLVQGVTLGHVIGYLLTAMPLQALQALPVSCLLGTLFVVGDLARNREYIAGLAGGIPPEKFLGGILIAGFVISLFALAADETVVPAATRYSAAVFREKINRLGEWRQTQYVDLFVAGSEGRMWNAKQFNANTAHMDRVIVDTFQNGRMVQQVDALKADWNKNGWTFTDGVIRTFAGDNISIANTENFTQRALPFTEKPGDLLIQEPSPEEMNYKTLREHINRLESLGVEVRRLRVELMMKLSFPFACFVVTCLGIPLAMRGRGNRAMGIAAAGVLTLLYMGFVQFGKAMGQRLIHPIVGAWMGNFTFMIIALVLWLRMRRTA